MKVALSLFLNEAELQNDPTNKEEQRRGRKKKDDHEGLMKEETEGGMKRTEARKMGKDSMVERWHR